MALKDDMDTVIATLQSSLDAMSFLAHGVKTEVDQDLIDAIQSDLDSLASDHDATFSTTWGGEEHEPTAEEIAHWLFDGYPADEHRLSITIAPTSPDERLTLVIDVPRS